MMIAAMRDARYQPGAEMIAENHDLRAQVAQLTAERDMWANRCMAMLHDQAEAQTADEQAKRAELDRIMDRWSKQIANGKRLRAERANAEAQKQARHYRQPRRAGWAPGWLERLTRWKVA